MHGFYAAEIFIYDSSVACCMFWAAKRWNAEAFQCCITIFWQQLGYLYQIKPSDAQVICSANPKV
jgi:hypothetical protein